MNTSEKEKILTHLVQILYDNAGNKMTLALVNGISVTHGQFLDTLLVAEPAVVSDNAEVKE